jgi:hypothetical protein
MITRVSEVIRGWLGWCPDAHSNTVKKERSWHETDLLHIPEQRTYVNDGVIIDYGATGISLRLFIVGIMAGIFGIFITVFAFNGAGASLNSLAGILWCGLIFLITIVILYQDLKRASLEITTGSLIINRSLQRPVVIRRDTIAAAEVQHNVPPVPHWLLKVLLLIVIPVSTAVIISAEYLQFTSGGMTISSFAVHFGFDISIVLFFIASYYHSRLRLQYPEVLVITTTTQKRVVMYGKNPEEIAGMLGKSV